MVEEQVNAFLVRYFWPKLERIHCITAVSGGTYLTQCKPQPPGAGFSLFSAVEVEASSTNLRDSEVGLSAGEGANQKGFAAQKLQTVRRLCTIDMALRWEVVVRAVVEVWSRKQARAPTSVFT